MWLDLGELELETIPLKSHSVQVNDDHGRPCKTFFLYTFISSISSIFLQLLITHFSSQNVCFNKVIFTTHTNVNIILKTRKILHKNVTILAPENNIFLVYFQWVFLASHKFNWQFMTLINVCYDILEQKNTHTHNNINI